MSTEINGARGPILVVKSWHAILTVLGWLVLAALQFAYVQAQTQQNAKDIERIKAEHVTRERFDELKEDILRRLQRIEDKLDRDRKNIR